MAIRLKGPPIELEFDEDEPTGDYRINSLSSIIHSSRRFGTDHSLPEGRALKFLTIDFDYWYLGGSEGAECHCGRCPDAGGSLRERPQRLLKINRAITPADVVDRCREGTPLYVTECHADLVRLLEWVVEYFKTKPFWDHSLVWNIDAHNDVGYLSNYSNLSNLSEPLYCGSWGTYAYEKGWLKRYYWVTGKDLFDEMPEPDIVHVCKSSPFLHPTGDEPLIAFIQQLEEKTAVPATVYGYGSKSIGERLKGGKEGGKGCPR